MSSSPVAQETVMKDPVDYEEKDLWQTEGVIDGESEDRESDDMMFARWGESGGEWTDWRKQLQEAKLSLI